MSDEMRLTPMFDQYMRIKEDYPDALLFYRMGDFYELFFKDAEVASRELQIALTSRNPNAEVRTPMCGVPHHAVDAYTAQLLEKGYTIAMCDQMEDPRMAKGLVRREVTRVLTPGTVLEDSNLVAKNNNFLAAVCWSSEKHTGALAWADISTGEWSGLSLKKQEELWQWIQKITPRELLIPEQMQLPLRLDNIRIVRLAASAFEPKSAQRRVLEAQKVQELAALGLESRPELLQACGALLTYFEQTHKQDDPLLAPFRPLDIGKYLIIDEVTERNLELFQRMDGRRGKGTLISVLDETITPMGGRLLAERLRYPWREQPHILETQECLQFFHDNADKHKTVRTALDRIYDLERLTTRIAMNRSYPKDFIALRQSLAALPDVHAAVLLSSTSYATENELQGHQLPAPLYKAIQHWDNIEDITQLLERALTDNPPQQITDGGLFKQGYNPELDEILDLVEHGEAKLQALLESEQKNHTLPRLKMGYNRVFGYYFEISKALNVVAPDHFIRRQTLANAERFTTVELKELESKVFNAAEKRKSLEYRLFNELRDLVANARQRVLFMADILANIDYWQGLAEAARRNGWVRPALSNGLEIRIREGRHPMVEAVLGHANFIPNDLYIDEKRTILLITGPNMAGKSTVLRQTALICIMTQMGSFVPAREAQIGLADRIFTRVGASDNLIQGQSTFMVEMMETARILRQATRRSLIILDEIGRGTSTFDGLALAWAVVEDLAQRSYGAIRTLFATHYHELTELDGKIPGIHNMNIAIREWNNEIIFLRKLVPGPSDRSYGIEVARLAGVPQGVVNKAKQHLAALERKRKNIQQARQNLPGFEPEIPEKLEQPPVATPCKAAEHPMLVCLNDTVVEKLSPLDALNLLAEWKRLWGTPDA